MYDNDFDVDYDSHEYSCPICGKETEGDYVCDRCERIADALECQICGAASNLSCKCC